MGTFSAIFFLVLAVMFIGAGVYIFVLNIKKMASTFPDGGGATTSSRLKIFLFLLVGLFLAAIGGALVLQVVFG
jgi:hypothetical protein